MAVQQASFYCPVCQRQRLFTAQNQVNHVFYLLLTLFSCGLWAIVWLIENLSYTPRFHCSQCGFSDSYKYLANPNLRSQEAQQNAERAALNAESLPSSSNRFVAWFSRLHIVKKVIAVYLGLVAIAVVVGAVSGIVEVTRTPTSISNSNSNANQTITSETTIVYPRGMSSAENLAKGRDALTRGDQRTAWSHLSEIKKGTKEFASAQPLLATIGEREKIEFELEQLREAKRNLENSTSGLAYELEPSELKERLDSVERALRKNFARQRELELKLKKLR